jgi:hypothetical protein
VGFTTTFTIILPGRLSTILEFYNNLERHGGKDDTIHIGGPMVEMLKDRLAW